jgi:SpoVK/Ycf46/Vps4 family AAA+-type ATPase
MTAQAIAGELGITVFIIRLDGLMSKIFRESIINPDTLMHIKEQFIFDEFDLIGSHRNQNQDVEKNKRVLNSFLNDQSKYIIPKVN